MGPNGAGKVRFSSIIAGNENYEVTEGEISLEGRSFSELAPEKAHSVPFFSIPC
jgi:Fe-S cluster assembly ATP-binding protein